MTKRIEVKGPIISNSDQWIYDWFGIDAVSPKKVQQQLDEAKGEDVDVVINSGGGSVYAASEIYVALKEYTGKTTGKIVGLAASAASVVAMGVKYLMMSPTAQMMIHNASTGSYGDYRDMDKTSDFLKNVNQTIANAYSLKSGKSYEELLSMMDEETWLTPQQAIEHNLIDKVMFENEVAATANVDRPDLVNGMLPVEVINRMREELANDKGLAVLNSTSQQKENGGENNMDLEKLKADHPELYNQVFNLGKDEGVKAERSRIQEIENIAMIGYEEIVNKAKFETGVSASEMAVDILKAQRTQNITLAANIQQDAAPLNQIAPTPEATPEAGQTVEDFADSILNKVGLGKGGK